MRLVFAGTPAVALPSLEALLGSSHDVVAVITRPEVYAPIDTDVLEGDRLTVRGITYEVQGNPQRWVNPFTGWQSDGLAIGLKLAATAGALVLVVLGASRTVSR